MPVGWCSAGWEACRSPAFRARAPLRGCRRRPLNTLVRTLKAIGCRALVLTNASGSLRPDLGPGSIVLIEDHINLRAPTRCWAPTTSASARASSISPRSMPSAAAPRRPPPRARGHSRWAGASISPCSGPSFETPAEIRAYRTLGADLVGMSTVPEAISARHAGLEVAALSVVTNLAAGLAAEPLTHADTLAQSAAAARRVGDLLEAALPEIARVLA